MVPSQQEGLQDIIQEEEEPQEENHQGGAIYNINLITSCLWESIVSEHAEIKIWKLV